MDDRQREIMKSLMQMALADGKVTESERALLDNVAEMIGCPAEELDTLAGEESHLEEVMIDQEDRFDAVRSLLVLSISDQDVDAAELDYLWKVVEKLGITWEDFEKLRAEATSLVSQGM